MSLFQLDFLIFLGLLVVFYYALPARFQWPCLLVFSLGFYLLSGGVGALCYVAVTALSIFFSAHLLQRMQQPFDRYAKENPDGLSRQQLQAMAKKLTAKKRWVVAALVVLNLGILAAVKYANFAFSQLNALLGLSLPEVNLLLPLGISFYTFQTIGYLVDVYRGKLAAEHNFGKFSLFVLFFPQIIQGPISRYEPLSKQLLEAHTFDYHTVKSGALRLLWGYFKVLVIANRAAAPVDAVFSGGSYTGLSVFLGVLLYGIQIYADFSGGIDIVLGAAEMLGIELPENFRRPFLARSISEFWQRWHITLGVWMRTYVFYPLSFSKAFTKLAQRMRKRLGNQTGKVLPACMASFIVFLLVGIWHGASWKYVVYGVFQAIFVSSATLLEKPYANLRSKLRIRDSNRLWQVFQVSRTLVLITLGRYLTRADSLMSAIGLWKSTFLTDDFWNLAVLDTGMATKEYLVLLAATVLLFTVDGLNEKGICVRDWLSRQTIVLRWTVYFAAIFAITVFGTYGIGYATQLIYQGF